jgi:hypothetical protein
MTTQMTTQDRDTRRVARFVAGTFQAVRHWLTGLRNRAVRKRWNAPEKRVPEWSRDRTHNRCYQRLLVRRREWRIA